MSRTLKDMPRYKYKTQLGIPKAPYGKPGIGKYYKRVYHKSMRSYHRGTGGKLRCVVRTMSNLNWRDY